MATFIKSEWRLTLGSTVLLDYDERMLDEPTFPQQHLVQVQPYLRSDWVDTWDRGGVTLRTEFSAVKEFNTPAEARDYQIRHSLTLAALRDAPLKIEVRGGGVFELTAAAIESAEPRIGIDLGAANRCAWTYSIVGSQLVDNTPT